MYNTTDCINHGRISKVIGSWIKHCCLDGDRASVKLALNKAIDVQASLLAIATEIPLSWTSPMYPKLYSTDKDVNPLDKPITENEDAWIGSLVTIGAAFGPIPFGYLTQKLGSKIGLLAISVPFIASSFALAFTNSIYIIYVCRVVAGLSVGGSYTVLNFYLAEVSQDHNRGRFSQATNICWSLGNFISYSVGPFVSYRTFNIMNACIPTIFFVLFLILAPESPYFLATNGNIEKTTKSLMLLRSADKEEVQEELQHIRNQVCKKEDDAKLCELFSNGALRRAFIICCVLVAVQELSGVCVITFYMQPIFESANTKLSAEHSTLFASFSILASSFVNPFFVDRAGRRILLIVSLFGTGISLIALGGFFYISESTNISTKSIFWLPLVSLIMYTFAFSFGISSIPSTLVSEIFPNNVKQACVTIIAFLGWGISFLLTRYYNCLRSALGAAGSFWIFAVCCLFGAIFCLFCVPETKGKSINEIQHILQSQSLFRYGFSKVTNNNDPKKKPFSNEMHINNGFI